MRMIWQAVRAVTIEALGIGAVIFILFSAAGWTVDHSVDKPKQQIDRAWQWVQDTTDDVATIVKPNLTAEEREQFAAERLDYYSGFYSEAASDYANGSASQATPSQPASERAPVLPTNQLLGTL